MSGYTIAVSVFLFFFKQKTAYEMRISDWSADGCSSDLRLQWRRSVLLLAARPRHHRADHLDHRILRRHQLSPGAQHRQGFGNGPRHQCDPGQIGRAPCRERVCQYVYIAVVAGSLKYKQHSTSAKTPP